MNDHEPRPILGCGEQPVMETNNAGMEYWACLNHQGANSHILVGPLNDMSGLGWNAMVRNLRMGILFYATESERNAANAITVDGDKIIPQNVEDATC